MPGKKSGRKKYIFGAKISLEKKSENFELFRLFEKMSENKIVENSKSSKISIFSTFFRKNEKFQNFSEFFFREKNRDIENRLHKPLNNAYGQLRNQKKLGLA